MQDDLRAISACLGGRSEAYRELVDRHALAVRGFLLRKLGDPEQADEAAHEAFIRAFQRLADLREPDRFLSWVLGIAANIASERLRRRHADGVERGVDLETRAIAADSDGDGAQAGGHAALMRSVSALPEPYRDAVLLRYWCGLGCEQAATAQGVAVGTLTKRLSRAHALLRDALSGGRGVELAEADRKEHENVMRTLP